jgi:hypothetical protein
MNNPTDLNSGNLSFGPAPGQPRPIHFEWRKWVAENVALEREPRFIVAHMVKSGFDEETVTREVREAMQHPYVAAVRKLISAVTPTTDNQADYKLKKRDSVLKCLQLNARQSPQFGTVARLRKPSRQQFLDEYYALSRPVLIEGAMEDWPPLTQWTLENLKQRFGDRIVEVQANRSADPNYERNAARLKTQMSFGQFVDLVRGSGQSNNFYMTAANSGTNWEALHELWNEVPLLSEYLVKNPTSPGYLWIGPAGTVTPLHHDLTNGLLAQIRGRKLFRLIAPFEIANVYNDRHCFSEVDIDKPDPQRFPLFADVTVHEVVLHPGELLLVPVAWWHYVRALEESIMITFNNFPVRNEFGSFYSTY